MLHPFLLLTLLLVSLVAAPAEARRSRHQHPRRPNILVIMSDDQGTADLSLRGSFIQTPNIDSLAREGVELTHFWAQPYCVPTRAAIMTGTSDQVWMYRVVRQFDLLPPETPTLAERFQRAGYETALIGKWHLGITPESHPNAKGFEHFYGHLGGAIDYFTKIGIDIVTPTGERDWQRNGVEVLDEGYATTQIADETIALLERRVEERDRRPFFYFVSFNAPHGPWSAPVEAFDPNCTAHPGICLYQAVVQQMDHEIGRILGTLDDLRLDKNTLVVFLMDNGGQAFTNNGGLKGRKFSTTEGGIRVPAFVRYPRRILRHEVRAPTHVQDLWATFEAAASLPKESPSSSVNRWPAVQGYGGKPRPPMFFSNQREACRVGCLSHLDNLLTLRSSAVIRWPWKLINSEQKNRNFVVPGSQRVELYDLSHDPFEEFNRAADKPGLVERLGAELMRWEEEGDTPRSPTRVYERRRRTARRPWHSPW